ARQAAAEAARHARAATDAANVQAEAMRRASRAAVAAADAQRLAADAAARAAAAGRNQPPPGGGGGNPPPGGPPPLPPRRRPPPPGGGGGGLGRTSGAQDLNTTYQVVQDAAQGGLAGVANQVPQIVQLLAKYAKVLGPAAAVVAGVAVGYAVANPTKIRDLIGDWITGLDKEVEASNQFFNVQKERLKAYKLAKAREDAAESGRVQGENAANRVKAQQSGAESRDSTLQRNLDQQEKAMELKRVQIEGTHQETDDESKRIQALQDLEKEWITKKAQLIRDYADYEYQKALQSAEENRKALEANRAAQEGEKKAAGATGSSPKMDQLKAAEDGLKQASDAATELMVAKAKEREEAIAGVQAAAWDAKIIDQKALNEKEEQLNKARIQKATKEAEDEKKAADEAAREALAASKRRIRDFWRSVERVTSETLDAVTKNLEQDKNRKSQDEDQHIKELRARGRNKEADKLQKEKDIGKIAEQRFADVGGDREDARRFAEKEYSLDHPGDRRRIRGAGRKRPGEPEPKPFSLDDPGFRNLGNTQYKTIAPSGTVHGGIPDPATGTWRPMPGQEKSGPAWGGSDGKGGLDGLDQMQKRNRRIRGAGFKGDSAPSTDSQPQERPVGTSSPGGAIGTAILSTLTSMNRKLDNLSPSKQVSRH
ncbi:MAG: hypothetical protein JWM59_1864, partial [Verrucomicrobiales bacterium]|nr:hypothetical protein [Verrucomicrobiales bacterium]